MANIAAGKVPVLETASAAWRFTVNAGLRLLPAAAILGLALTVVELLVASFPAPNPLSDPNGLAFMALEFASGVIIRAFFGAVVLRLIMRDQFSRPTGLQFGADEIRILMAQLGAALIYVPVGLAIVVTPALLVFQRLDQALIEAQRIANDPQVFAEQAAVALGDTGAALLFLLMLALMLAMFGIMVRLSLVQAASFAEGRVVVRQTWKWTHGNLVRVALAHLAAFVPATLIASLLFGLFQSLAGGPDTNPDAATLVGLKALGNVLTIAADIPTIALMAHLYRGLRPPDFQPL
jgi:hypothetical protein